MEKKEEDAVLRSGIEVYGRRRGTPSVPDEHVRVDPTTGFGHTLLKTELLVHRNAGPGGCNRVGSSSDQRRA